MADTISSIMEGVLSLSETINYYDTDLVKLMNELLSSDSTSRPNSSVILSHPYILPYTLNSNSHWFKFARNL